MKRLVFGSIIALAVLHQDFWWWDNSDWLVFGFMPIGLAYHALISMAAAFLWALAVKYCWPLDVEIPDTPDERTEPNDGADS
jgi:hypothetical protein